MKIWRVLVSLLIFFVHQQAFPLFAQTSLLKKGVGSAPLQKARRYGVSNTLILNKWSVAGASQASVRSLKNKYEGNHLSGITTTGLVGNPFLVGLRYNTLWRTGPKTFLGFGIGGFYLGYNVPVSGLIVSATESGFGVYIPLIFRWFMGSNVYLEPFAGPEYISTTANYSYYSPYVNGGGGAVSTSYFQAMAGCNLGYKFKSRLDVSLRYRTDFGFGLGIGLTKR